MSGLRIPGFTINKDKTRLRRGSFESVGSLRSAASALEEPSVDEGKKEENWMEKAYYEHKEQRELEVSEMNNRRKQSRKQALHLSKAMTQIKEATLTVGELSDFALSSLKNNQVTSRDVTLEELAAELKANEDRRKEEGDNLFGDVSDDAEGTDANEQQSRRPNLIDSVATLTKVTRRITARKEILEKQVKALRDEYIKEKKNFERQLQDAIGAMNKLREEKDDAELKVREVRLEFEKQIRDLERNAEDARRKLQILEVMNKDLQHSLEDKETQLLDVPQMEENYLRTARALVVKKERAVIEKSMLLKQAEEKVKSSGFWHRKAVLLAEENLSIKKELEECKRNNIQAVTRLQRELQWETSRNQPHNAHVRQPPTVTRQHLKREDADEGGDGPEIAHVASTGGTAAVTGTGTVLGPETSHEEHVRQFQAAELARLRGVVSSLQDANKTLSLKLADARAYPLYNTRAAPEDDVDGEKTTAAEELEALFHPDNEEEENQYFETDEDREARETEERVAAQQRVERAVNMSFAYKSKLEQIRKARKKSDHFKALRKLKTG